MNRVFFSLYLVIVISVVVVGQGANKLWQLYNPEPEVGEFEGLFFAMLDGRLAELSHQNLDASLKKIEQSIGKKLSHYSLDDLAKSSLSEKIASGNIVSVVDSEGVKSTYKRIKNSNSIVRLHLGKEKKSQGVSYIILLVAFYAGIAIIIYFWIWPLSRDLKKLTAYTQKVGEDLPGHVELGQRSTVYPLAAAFNVMAGRIHELFASHKEMTYAVSHELRTPLARMKFALEMAIDTKNINYIHKQLGSVRKDVAEMDALISGLLAYAGFEQRKQKLTLSDGDLPSLVDNVIALNFHNKTENNINCRVCNKLPNSIVQCEWSLFERCIQNLIQNALRYANKEILVTMAIENKHYYLAVEDDGPGIPEADRKKIFNAFVRLRNKPDEDKSGFGLGLAIVNRIMKWHDGTVEVVPSQFGGAKFILIWPISSN